MAFDREGAKAAGYTDAEIDAYLQGASGGSAAARVATPAATAPAPTPPGYTGTPDLPLEADPFSPLDIPAAFQGVRAGVAGVRALPGALRALTAGGARMAGEMASAPVLRHLPGASKVRNIAEDVAGLAGGAADKARGAVGAALSRIKNSPASAERAADKASGHAMRLARNQEEMNAARGRVVGEIKPAAKTKPVRAPKKKAPAKGTAASRVKTQTPDEVAAARAKGRAEAGGKSQAMRGASKPALERRAAARASATKPEEVDDLKDILEQSIEVEAAMSGKGLSQAERSAVRAAVRGTATEAPARGAAASRVAKAAKSAEEGSRHEVQYYSESQGKFIPIESMHIAQLKNSMNKLHRKLMATDRPSPVTQKQFEALRDEVTYRLKQAGELTVY